VTDGLSRDYSPGISNLGYCSTDLDMTGHFLADPESARSRLLGMSRSDSTGLESNKRWINVRGSSHRMRTARSFQRVGSKQAPSDKLPRAERRCSGDPHGLEAAELADALNRELASVAGALDSSERTIPGARWSFRYEDGTRLNLTVGARNFFRVGSQAKITS
jgi:hypothetical protein